MAEQHQYVKCEQVSRRLILKWMAAVGTTSSSLRGVAGGLGAMADQSSGLILRSSNSDLVAGFEWAKQQALSYIHDSDPVGPWYEAALPGRSAFCMRDVSHMSTGAHVLGLAAHNRNMLRHFAESISPDRDWCGYWEITKDNLPAPADYQSDKNFWYNLPANFDVMCACYRQYLWTRDPSYLKSPFLEFYQHSLTDYIKTWDHDGDGIPDQPPGQRSRGIPTYVEDFRRPVSEGADLVAAQYGAYLAYAAIEAEKKAEVEAAKYRAKAEQLRNQFNSTWWNEKDGNYYLGKLPDGAFRADLAQSIGNSEAEFILIFELPDTPQKTTGALGQLLGNKEAQTRPAQQMGGVEGRSYIPGILYQYGDTELAYKKLAEMWDPALARREYPEVSFTIVGSTVTGLMGISPQKQSRTVETFSSLPEGTEWAEIEGVPIFDNRITIRQTQRQKTLLKNSSGAGVTWRASFPGTYKKLIVDGVAHRAQSARRLNEIQESFVLINVPARGAKTVEAPQQ
jgi:hypothetical protein